MCGRCRLTLRPDEVLRACHLPHSPVHHVDIDRYRPAYNVSPGAYFPVVRRESGGTEGFTTALHCMKWGLIPSFTNKNDKPDHYKMFNARSESITEKASFRRLVPKNRCLVAVEGFYEWKKGPKKQPYYIHFPDGRPLVFAALYDSWKNAEGEILCTFTIITTASSSALQWLHDRMPVILGDEASTDLWLNGSSDTKFGSLLKPYEKTDLAWYPVTTAMNKASFDGPDCINEIQSKREEPINPITKFFSKPETTNNKESKKEVNKSLEESSKKTNPQYDIHEESEAKPGLELENKVDVSSLPSHGCDKKVELKRDYEKLTGDSKLNIGEVRKVHPTRTKKSKGKSGAEKQTTLRSYFGKS